MGKEEITLNLIGLIYDAAEDPAKWPAFLERFADALNGTVTTLLNYDAQFQNGNLASTVRIDQVDQARYNRQFVQLDVFGARGKLLPQGSIRNGQQLCPDELLVKSEFYNDFLKPINLFHEMCGVIVKQENKLSVINSLRPKAAGPFDKEELRLVEILMPHLQRAVQFHRRIVALESETRAAVGTLDHLHIGLIQLGRYGKVLSMNRAAAAIIAQGDGLSVASDGLCASRTHETRSLRALISDAARTSEGIGFGSGGALAISRPSLKRPFSVIVSPSPTSGLKFNALGGAVLFVTDPETLFESDEEILKSLFGLTASEARMASLLVQGHDLNEICGELLIRRNTARTHLRHLFEKLGVRRQGELISLLLRTVGAVRAIRPPA